MARLAFDSAIGPAGQELVREGDQGTDVFHILDGVIRVGRRGEHLAEYGPGALQGERAHLEGGVRTSTLVAVTPCRVASVAASTPVAQPLRRAATSFATAR